MNDVEPKKRRHYATIVYPESAPANWLDILSETHMKIFVSPLHDQDQKQDGSVKKPHYHVLLSFDGPVVPDRAQQLFLKVGGVGLEKVDSYVGMARYLCHLDERDKIHYSTTDVLSLGGADYFDVIQKPSDKYFVIGEMIDFCSHEKIYSYAALLKYARANDFGWFKVLCDSGTLVMREFLKSMYWSDKNDESGQEFK
jgi:hypothetical protein